MNPEAKDERKVTPLAPPNEQFVIQQAKNQS
jgi:hypothetical protein